MVLFVCLFVQLFVRCCHHATHFLHHATYFRHHGAYFWDHAAHFWHHVAHFWHHNIHFWHHLAHFHHWLPSKIVKLKPGNTWFMITFINKGVCLHPSSAGCHEWVQDDRLAECAICGADTSAAPGNRGLNIQIMARPLGALEGKSVSSNVGSLSVYL